MSSSRGGYWVIVLTRLCFALLGKEEQVAHSKQYVWVVRWYGRWSVGWFAGWFAGWLVSGGKVLR